MPENVSPRNADLAALYSHHWPELRRIMKTDERLSLPYLAWVHPDYELVKVRLVVVGKETSKGWAKQHRDRILGMTPDQAAMKLTGPEVLRQVYKEFKLGKEYRGKASFWTPVHELYRRLNPNGPEFGFVALNASKMDLLGRTPGEQVRSDLIATGLLPAEIRILDPHVVVFQGMSDGSMAGSPV
jgi:hypothetical protein